MPERSKRDVKDLLKSLHIQCEVDDEVFTLVSETNPTVKAFLHGEITFQEALFVENYLNNGFNAARAARSANFQGLEAGAYGRVGHGVLKKGAIKAIVARRITNKALSSDEVLAEWAEVAKADIAQFMNVQDREDPHTGELMRVVVPDLENAEAAGLLHLIKKFKIAADGSFSFELRDQDKALEQIARHLGMFEKDNTLQIPKGLLDLLNQSPEERRETLDRYEDMMDQDED